MDGHVVAKGLQRRKRGPGRLLRVIDIYDADGRLLSHERAGVHHCKFSMRLVLNFELFPDRKSVV